MRLPAVSVTEGPTFRVYVPACGWGADSALKEGLLLPAMTRTEETAITRPPGPTRRTSPVVKLLGLMARSKVSRTPERLFAEGRTQETPTTRGAERMAAVLW